MVKRDDAHGELIDALSTKRKQVDNTGVIMWTNRPSVTSLYHDQVGLLAALLRLVQSLHCLARFIIQVGRRDYLDRMLNLLQQEQMPHPLSDVSSTDGRSCRGNPHDAMRPINPISKVPK